MVLTVSPKAAHLLVLQPQNVLQPVGFVEVRESRQSTNQDCQHREETQKQIYLQLTAHDL